MENITKINAEIDGFTKEIQDVEAQIKAKLQSINTNTSFSEQKKQIENAVKNMKNQIKAKTGVNPNSGYPYIVLSSDRSIRPFSNLKNTLDWHYKRTKENKKLLKSEPNKDTIRQSFESYVRRFDFYRDNLFHYEYDRKRQKDKLNELEIFLTKWAPKSLTSRFTRSKNQRDKNAIEAATEATYQEQLQLWNKQRLVRETLEKYYADLQETLEEVNLLYKKIFEKNGEYKNILKTIKTRKNTNTRNLQNRLSELRKQKNSAETRKFQLKRKIASSLISSPTPAYVPSSSSSSGLSPLQQGTTQENSGYRPRKEEERPSLFSFQPY